MRWIVVVATGLLLSGCATGIMEGFVGQPLQVGMARYGPPANVFDMPDGRRAFQWQIDSETYMPRQTYGTVNVYAPPGSYTANANYSQTTYGGQTIRQSCLYTMYARWQPSQNAWIFESFEKPSIMCM